MDPSSTDSRLGPDEVEINVEESASARMRRRTADLLTENGREPCAFQTGSRIECVGPCANSIMTFKPTNRRRMDVKDKPQRCNSEPDCHCRFGLLDSRDPASEIGVPQDDEIEETEVEDSSEGNLSLEHISEGDDVGLGPGNIKEPGWEVIENESDWVII